MRELKIGSLGTYYQHFNLLILYGYLSAEQRKVSGRFDICIYRLNDMVDLEAPPNPLPTKRKKGMSEKPEHGGILLKTDFATSEKPMSEKMEYGKPGQAKNNNIVTRNSYFMIETC